MDDAFERFAADLIRLARDPAIRECDALLRRELGGERAERWAQAVAAGVQPAAEVVIPDAIDAVLAMVIDAVQNGRIELYVKSGDGVEFSALDELSDGEAFGYFVGEDGLRDQYAEERYYSF